MRRRLRRKHAFDAALAETVGIRGKTLGEVVAHERGRDRAARRDAEPAADERTRPCTTGPTSCPSRRRQAAGRATSNGILSGSECPYDTNVLADDAGG